MEGKIRRKVHVLRLWCVGIRALVVGWEVNGSLNQSITMIYKGVGGRLRGQVVTSRCDPSPTCRMCVRSGSREKAVSTSVPRKFSPG